MSARKLALAVLVPAVFIAGAGYAIWSELGADTKPAYATRQLQLKDRSVTLEVADTPDKQELGLGQRDSLPEDRGMVFPYDKDGNLCFWMKDMRFSIDMIWLDSSKEVLRVESNVSPQTYPKSFCPDKPARYVVELNANQAEQLGIEPGQQLKF